jgi:hypothetical protein
MSCYEDIMNRSYEDTTNCYCREDEINCCCCENIINCCCGDIINRYCSEDEISCCCCCENIFNCCYDQIMDTLRFIGIISISFIFMFIMPDLGGFVIGYVVSIRALIYFMGDQ